MLIVPAFLLILVPLWLVLRRGPRLTGEARALLAFGVAALVLATLPWGGVDYESIKRLNIFIAGGVCLALALKHPAFVPGSRTQDRWKPILPLAGLAAFAMVAHVNFFQFHGLRTFVHLHDVAHYYIGSKYYEELGYTDLYTGMLRAEAELHDNHFQAIEARDLATYDRVHIRSLLQRSDPVKAAFTPERWHEFEQDVEYFREALGPLYGTMLLDHGFNPTPVWALIGGTLASWVPGGSARGIWLLSLLDPLLLAGAALAVGWAFGRRVAALAILYFCVIFGTNFGWTGGAFLRYMWFAAVVVAVCCMARRRYAWAGAGFALAAALRVFPAGFLVPLGAKALWILVTKGFLPRRYLRLFASFAITGALLFAATGMLPRGFDHWHEFRVNMQTHILNISPNVIGLTDVLAFRLGAAEQVTQEEFSALKERRAGIKDAQMVIVFVPVALAVCWLARRRTDLDALLLAFPLFLTGLSLAAYYYAFLVVALIVRRRSSRDLALLFGLEAASHALLLFEQRDGLLHIYRSVALIELVLLLFMDPIRREIRDFSTWRRRVAATAGPS